MACFKITGPNGSRLQPEGEPYRLAPGEAIVEGFVDWACGPRIPGDPDYTDRGDVLVADGKFMVGNAVKKLTQALHIPHCFKCSQRQRRWNEAGIRAQEKLKGFLGA